MLKLVRRIKIQKNETAFDPPYLTEQDWSFENVPASEIIACCLWEYARESPSIAMAADQHWCNVRHISNRQRYKLEPGLKAEHDEEAASVELRLRSRGFHYGNFLDAFWASDLAAVEIYQSITEHVIDGARAWQELPLENRAKLIEQVSKSFLLHPLTPSWVGELETLWKVNRGDLEGIRSKPRPENDDSEDAALYAESSPVVLPVETQQEPPGKMAVAFTINFSCFTDNEICAEMKGWLDANRPVAWKAPKRVFPDSKQRGRKRAGKQTEYATALNRLGLMRLLHWLTPNEIRRDLPKAWVSYSQKKDSFRREVREACKFFQKLFPFLPENERPNSEPRKGVWFPKMMQACEKIDKEPGFG